MTKKILYASFILAAFVLSFSCATGKNVRDSGNIRIIENVPFFAQEDFQCGPASLAGALNYRGIAVTPDEIAKEIFSESAKGTLNIDMVIYAQKKGLIADQYKGNMEDLKKNIDSGNPLIVLVDYGFSLYQVNHFMVIVGYNDAGVIADSGKTKSLFIAERDLLRIWKKTNFWTLLIKPK